jgi:hypothetical protein
MHEWTRRLVFVSMFSLGFTLLLGRVVGATIYPGEQVTLSRCEYSPNGANSLCVRDAWTEGIDHGLRWKAANLSDHCYAATQDRNWWSILDGESVYDTCDAYGTHEGHEGQLSTIWAVMQGDGNFVLYDAGGSSVWHTQTHGYDNNPKMEPQNDSNLVMYENGVVRWALW